MTCTQSQLKILQHTLGINEHKREPYRNYYVAGNGHHAMNDLDALVSAGLMFVARKPAFLADGDVVYACSEAGKSYAIENLPALPNPGKKNNYDDFLSADACMSFAEFLGITKPKYELRRQPGCGKYGYLYEYRMYRIPPYWREDMQAVYGDWMPTKKEAKASYKDALNASKGGAA